MRNKLSFQQMVSGQLGIHRHKNEVGPSPYTIHKNALSTQIRDLNVRAKTIRQLGENTGVNLCGLGSGFLATTPKAEVTQKPNR